MLLLTFMKQTKRLGKSEISGESRSGREGYDAKESPSFEEINTTSIPVPIRYSLSFSPLLAQPCPATRPPFHPLPWCSRICAAFRELERYFEVRRPSFCFNFVQSLFRRQLTPRALKSAAYKVRRENKRIRSIL